MAVRKAAAEEVNPALSAEPGTVEAIWFRDATAEAHPVYPDRTDEEALTDEQKAHLKENGLR